jgi:hypothetical protein
LAGKDAISGGHFTGMPPLLPPFSISQNPAKDQALPPVAALRVSIIRKYSFWVVLNYNMLSKWNLIYFY